MSTEHKSSSLAASVWGTVKLIFTRDSVARERILQRYLDGEAADRLAHEARQAGSDARIRAAIREDIDAAFAKIRAERALQANNR